MRFTTQHHSDGDYEAGKDRAGSTRLGVLLWIVQVLLALLFLFAGGMKLVVPIAMLTKQVPLPGPFLRFIGLAEFAGALGLILPGLLRIRPTLTPLAAGGLVIIMSGATGIMMAGGVVEPALPPFVVGLLAGFVAYGRTRLVPLREARGAARASRSRAASPVLQRAG